MERFVTVPIEIAMTGLPGLTEMRSLNRNGLSIVTLVFTDKTDVFFARNLVLESGIACSPCLSAYNHRQTFCDGDNQCLKRIAPDPVLAQALQFLGSAA